MKTKFRKCYCRPQGGDYNNPNTWYKKKVPTVENEIITELNKGCQLVFSGTVILGNMFCKLTRKTHRIPRKPYRRTTIHNKILSDAEEQTKFILSMNLACDAVLYELKKDDSYSEAYKELVKSIFSSVSIPSSLF